MRGPAKGRVTNASNLHLISAETDVSLADIDSDLVEAEQTWSSPTQHCGRISPRCGPCEPRGTVETKPNLVDLNSSYLALGGVGKSTKQTSEIAFEPHVRAHVEVPHARAPVRHSTAAPDICGSLCTRICDSSAIAVGLSQRKSTKGHCHVATTSAAMADGW